MFGVIGGTGLHEIEGFSKLKSLEVDTPFGKPSAPITIGKIANLEVAFMPRHGASHHLLPSEINYRANIWALKSIGVTKLIGVSAVGSLNKEIRPGDLALPDQYIDWTRGQRALTFFGDGLVAHVSTAEPTCPVLASEIAHQARNLDLTLHEKKTYVCVEGPRLGTKAESRMFQLLGANLVGMTNAPEVFLAREAQLCYTTITIATDYDCWLDDPEQHVSSDKVLALYRKNIGSIQALLLKVIENAEKNSDKKLGCGCRTALEHSVMTSDEHLTEKNRELLKILKL